jgi:hypothetical protein
MMTEAPAVVQMSEANPINRAMDPSQEPGIDEPLDEQATRRSGRRFRLLLDGGSLALFLIFCARLLPVLLGADVMDPIWQGEFVEVLVDQGLLAFLGFILLHLAVYLQPRHDRLRRRLRLVRRLAVPVVIGYLLLVPLQLSSSIGELTAAQSQKEIYLKESSDLSEIREAVKQATNVQDMNVRLQSLLQPALTAEQLNLSLPQLRQTLLKVNEAKQEEVSQKLIRNADNLDSFGAVVSRVGSALGWALAFAAGAVPWGSRSTLFERLRRQ